MYIYFFKTLKLLSAKINQLTLDPPKYICTETVFWDLNRLVPIEVLEILEFFHQKP